MSRWPIFEMLPSRALPAECFFGVKPVQAAKSRPLRNWRMSEQKAFTAVALITPTLGIVISLATSVSSGARVRIYGIRTLGFYQLSRQEELVAGYGVCR